MDLSILFIVIQLIFLEGILSIDNAAVLGAMVAHLPDDKPIPWPRRLQFLARWSERALGPQRQAALKVGLLGAYIGRAAMLLLASIIINVPWIRVLGAAYLVYLGVEHFGRLYHQQREAEGHEGSGRAAPKGGFWSVVLAVELVDLAFSVDNVIAAVALSDRFWVVLLGVSIGIVIMRFAATLFSRMILWEPALEHGAYLLLLAIGSELLLKDLLHLHFPELLQFAISVGLLVLTVVFARVSWLAPVRIVFMPFLALFAALGAVISVVKGVFMLPLHALNRSSKQLSSD